MRRTSRGARSSLLVAGRCRHAAGVAAGLGRSATARRSSGTTARSPLQGAERGLGRPHGPARRRPQRDRRLPGDRRGGRRGHPRALTPRCRSCAGDGGSERSSTQRPPPIRRCPPGRPIQLFSVHYMNVTAGDARRLGLEAGKPGGASRHHSAGSRCSSCRRTRDAGRGGFPLAVGARPRPVDLDRDLRRAASLPPGIYRGHASRSPPTAEATSLPVELRVFGFTLPDENSLPAMVYYETDQPELYQGRNLDPAYHRFAHRHRVELVHAYDEARCEAHRGRFDGSDFTASAGYEGPGEGIGNTHRPGLLLRTGPGVRGEGERLEALRRLDGRSWRRRSRGADVPLPARRALPGAVPARSGARRERALEPGPRAAASALPHQADRPGAPGARRHLEHPAAGARHRGGGSRARGGPPGLVLQRRAPAGADARDRRAGDGGARRRRGRPSSTTLDLYFFWHGDHWQHNRQKQGERKQNVWANPITFDNRGQPHKPVDDQGFINGDGVLLYPGRRSCTRRRTAASRGRCRHGPAREPPPRPAGPPVPDPRPPARARAEVKEALAAVVPRVFSDAGETVGFAETGETFEAARLELARGDRVAPMRATHPCRPRRRRPRRTTAAVPTRSRQARPVAHPRMLVAERDAFTGLPALKARWAAGERPSRRPARPRAFVAPLGRRVVRAAGARGAPRRSTDRLEGLEPLRPLPEPRARFRLALRLPRLRRGAQGRGGQGPRGGRVARCSRCQSLADPSQASYHNHTARELALAVFSLVAVEGHASVESQAAPLRAQAWRALDNILEQTELVNPDGGYHESTDYMRITWAPLAMMAEVRRTATGYDPASRWSVFRNMGPTYLYKVLPDGSEARDDDDEFPHLDSRDNVVLGYAVHRFKDPYAAFLLKQRAWLPAEWANPVLEFLWSDAVRRAARSGDHDRERAAAAPAVPRHRPPGAARRLGRGLDLDRARLRPVLREARPPRRGALRRLPQGLPGDRRGRRLHGHREPALPQPLPPHGRPQHDARLPARARPSSGARTAGRPPTTAASAWTRRASGTASGASRTCGARATSGTAAGSIRWRPSPATAMPAPTRRAPTSRRSSSASRASWSTCASRTSSSCSTASARPIPPSARPGCSTAWASRRSKPRPRARASATGGTSYRDASLVTFEDGQGRLRVHPLLPREREVIVRGGAGPRVLDAGRRARRCLGLGPELAARPARGRPAARRSLPAQDVADVLGRHREAVAVEPPRRGAGRMADGGLAQGAGEGGRVPPRARDRRPRRQACAADRGHRGHGLAGASIEDEATVLFAAAAARGSDAAGRADTAAPARAGLEPARVLRDPGHLGIRAGVAGLAGERRSGRRRHARVSLGWRARRPPAPEAPPLDEGVRRCFAR